MVALFAASFARLHLCYVVSAEGKKGHDMKSSLPNEAMHRMSGNNAFSKLACLCVPLIGDFVRSANG
jgi:hypothetical protein